MAVHQTKRWGYALLATAFAGLLGSTSVVLAQGYGGPHGGGEGMYGFEEMQRLHDALKLNPQQETLWKQSQETSREVFRKMRTSMKEAHEKISAELDKPGADLKKLQPIEDGMHEQMEAARKQVRAARIALYDTLDAGQKETVRLAIKKRMEHREHMGMRGMRNPHGSPQEGGPAKDAPAPGKN